MTKKTPAKRLPMTQEREALLWSLWDVLAGHIVKTLSTVPPQTLKASFLDVARQFLKDNGINKDSLPGTGREDLAEKWQEVLNSVPNFDAIMKGQ